MKLVEKKLFFQSCESSYKEGKVVIFSAPMDSTTSFKPGTRFAGNAIRNESLGLEWYSPYADKSLKDYQTADIGDLDLTIGNVKENLTIIEQTTSKILNDGKKSLMIGGEHLVTYGTVKAYLKKYPDLRIIHFDAHTDLRQEFFGMKFSHATVIRRIHDLVGDNRIYQFGIRSGDKEEFLFAENKHTYMEKFYVKTLGKIVEEIKNYPVYITIDLDVLDPSIFPGTGTPEPGGITFQELLEVIRELNKLNKVVGADIVELAPIYDQSGVSSIVAGKTLRELIFLLHK